MTNDPNEPETPGGPPPQPEGEGTIFNPQFRVPVPGRTQQPDEEPAAEEPPPADSEGADPWGAPAEPQSWDEQPAAADVPHEPEQGWTGDDPDEPAQDWGEAPEPEPEPVPVTRPPSATISGLQNAPIKPEPHAQGIKVGDVLNHIFEIKRFIARGGMGEVFEAVNVNSDERLAVKVMLPSLAADPNVIQMFRREARTMTRLNHEALVQYRVLAQEPNLGVLYIVTEYIDGVSLGDVLGTVKANGEDLAMLLRRLASGLRAAHNLGILHRDMSPDNVLLEGGRLSSAKVVDFGIAKDLNPGTATIIGDGFAGKLGYVAPEQLGDFNRELGPWTDVYSLGLVILATAIGRDVQMGGTLVDAVDKRRHGPDLSSVPDSIRPVLEGMLKANPTERLRSMDEVLDALDGSKAPPAPPPVAPTGSSGGLGGKRNLIVAGVAGVLLLGTAGIWLSSGGDEPASGNGTAATTGGAPAARAGDPLDTAREAIDSAIPSIGCSWLDIVKLEQGSGQVNVTIGGVAGRPAAAQGDVASALSSSNVQNPNIDFASVAQIQPAGCAVLDAYRQIRNMEAPRLTADQRVWEKSMQEGGGVPAARMVIRMRGIAPGEEVALLGLEPSGQLSALLPNRAAFVAALTNPNYKFTRLGDDGFELQMDVDHDGWSGLILVTGQGPLPADLLSPPLGARTTQWKEQLVSTAASKGWRADMLWLKSEDARPN